MRSPANHSAPSVEQLGIGLECCDVSGGTSINGGCGVESGLYIYIFLYTYTFMLAPILAALKAFFCEAGGSNCHLLVCNVAPDNLRLAVQAVASMQDSFVRDFVTQVPASGSTAVLLFVYS